MKEQTMKEKMLRGSAWMTAGSIISLFVKIVRSIAIKPTVPYPESPENIRAKGSLLE